MRRNIALVFAILSIFIATSAAFAGDILFMLTHNYQQKALFIGEVMKVNGRTIEVNVNHTVVGKVPNKITVDVDDWNWKRVNGVITGDKLILSVDEKGPNYKVKWGIFRVSSLDYKTLRLIDPEPVGDFEIFQWYVNNNGKYTDFSFVGGAVYGRDEAGNLHKIILNSTKDTSPSITEGNMNLSTETKAKFNKSVGGIKFIAGVGALILGLIAIAKKLLG